jgi:enoyl-CoA hydratase/carnithine racemase
MAYETIRCEFPAEGVALVTLSRPHAANALSQALFKELDDVLDRIEHDDNVRVWLITGAPRPDGSPWFSAGADLKEAVTDRSASPSTVDSLGVVDRIDDLKPSIAVIGGFCTTGALELSMAYDLRVAAASARPSDWHLKATA